MPQSAHPAVGLCRARVWLCTAPCALAAAAAAAALPHWMPRRWLPILPSSPPACQGPSAPLSRAIFSSNYAHRRDTCHWYTGIMEQPAQVELRRERLKGLGQRCIGSLKSGRFRQSLTRERCKGSLATERLDAPAAAAVLGAITLEH